MVNFSNIRRRRGQTLFAGIERSRTDGEGMAKFKEMYISSGADSAPPWADETYENTSPGSPVPYSYVTF